MLKAMFYRPIFCYDAIPPLYYTHNLKEYSFINGSIPKTNAHLSWNLQNFLLYTNLPLYVNTTWFRFFSHTFKDVSAYMLYTFVMGSVAWRSVAYAQKKLPGEVHSWTCLTLIWLLTSINSQITTVL